MYIPKHFEVTDKQEALEFIKFNAFGQLISTVEGRLFVSHLPFLVSDDRKSILCHLAKNNPQWKGIEEQEILVTFQGPHDYVSPNWYSSPGVPTWNYQAVHVGTPGELYQFGEMIENYPEDARGHSCLMLGVGDGEEYCTLFVPRKMNIWQ